jgi:hypothetical protein
VKYETVAEAYRDLEQASGRLALTDRLATLLTATPDELLPTVCYLCQGLIAPEFAGVDLGLAEKLAVRAVATATGTGPEQVAASVRETGDLGQAAEQLLATTAAGRPASLQVTAVVDTLHRIAEAEGTGSQVRKLELLGGLLAQATPLEARYLLRLVTGGLRLGIGTPTILDALAQAHAGGRAARPVLERAYNICCDLGRVAATLVQGGLAAVEQLQVSPGNPVRVMLAQRLSDAGEILGSWAAVRGRIQIRRRPRPGAPDRRRPDRAVHPAAGARQHPVPGRPRPRGGAGPQRGDRRGEVVAFDPAAGSCARSRRSCSGGASTASAKPCATCRWPVLLRAALRRRAGPHPVAVSGAAGRLADAITVAPRLRLTTATEVATPPTWTRRSSRRSPTAAKG